MADRYALVTGASRGIGECFARALASRGRNVVLVARASERLEQVTAELSEQHGVTARLVAVDLEVEGAIEELVQQLESEGVEIDLLVNNAAYGHHGEFVELAAEELETTIRVNALAIVRLTRALLPQMAARGGGAIINVSSTTSFMPMPHFAVYAATKAFVTSFSLALAEEARPMGVRVVTLCPGPTRAKTHSDGDFRSKIPPQPAEEVVELALRRMESGGVLVPRLVNKATALGGRWLPMQVAAKIAGRAMRPPD